MLTENKTIDEIMAEIGVKNSGYVSPWSHLEHVAINYDNYKNIETPSSEISTPVRGGSVLTYGLGVGTKREYVTISMERESTGHCLPPYEEKVTGCKHSETPQQAVQFHFDLVNYLNNS